MSDYTITLEDVQTYLDSRRDNEIIGVTCSGGTCLIALACKAKYPLIADIIASSTSIQILLYRDVTWLDVEMGHGISEMIDAFDFLVEGMEEQPITKRQWLESQRAVRA